MSLVKTIKAMVEEGHTISFSKADLSMDGVYITIKKRWNQRQTSYIKR